MRLIHSPEEFRQACHALRAQGTSVGLVPTMGALHRGHASLMRKACEAGTAPCVSIFVNPTQFGPNEDFAKYPRTLESDLELCEKEGTALVFSPAATDMYASGESTRVRVSGLTEGMCGASRPGHFDGVTTIVAKLFSLAGPCKAFFGMKDYQQLRVIQRMAQDLMLPVQVIGCPIIREADGLALSSRNRYLSSDERVRALSIVRGLAEADDAYRSGERSISALTGIVSQHLERATLRKDYIELRDAMSLTEFTSSASEPGQCVLAVAAFCGTTRLIDNVILGAEEPLSKAFSKPSSP